MKRKIAITVVAVAVLLTAGILSVDHYNKTKNKEAHDAQVVAKAQDDAMKAVAKQRDDYKALAVANFAECEKTRSQYDLLSPLAKRTQVKAACATVL